MHHTIYFNQKPLLLSDSHSEVTTALLQQSETLHYNQLKEANVQAVISQMQQDNVSGGVFIHDPLEELLQAFKSSMKVIVAGGGLVYTENNTLLLIFRKGTWDLPKGKVDAGETIAAAAVREVEEETGLTHIELEAPLTTTYHTYTQHGELILKESHWFLMKSTQQELTPQTEEDIEQCIWVPQEEVTSYYSNMYPAIKDVLQLGLQQLKA